jgi:hypothetical protein
MAKEYNCQRDCEEAEKEGLDENLREITYDVSKKKKKKEKICLQFTNDEAVIIIDLHR